jgi:nucleotide-binding universal stress UspA family protein
MRVLIPIDGSDGSLAALDRLLDKAGWFGTPLEIHLLNVQRPLPQDIGRFIGAESLHQLHHDRGMACLEAARKRAAARGANCQCHVVVGEIAETIVHFAHQQQCELIAIGTRGLGSLPGLLLGSVTTRVLHLADLPVLALK